MPQKSSIELCWACPVLVTMATYTSGTDYNQILVKMPGVATSEEIRQSHVNLSPSQKSSSSPTKLLLDWVTSLTDDEQKVFLQLRLGYIMDLTKVTVDWELLRSAVTCWNPALHVFCFGKQDLCPTIEEFGRILGVTYTGKLVHPTLIDSKLELCRFLDLEKKTSVDPYLQYSNINILALLHSFRSHKSVDIRMKVLGSCLVGTLLLSEGPGLCSLSVVGIMRYCSQGNYTIVPTILADIFESLDSFYATDTMIRGSPPLLQIWLAEHLKLMGTQSKSYNVVYLYLKTGYVPRNILRTHGHCIVSILGLKRRSFYCPLLVVRQLGFIQDVPELSGSFYGSTDLTPAIIQRTIEAWDKRDQSPITLLTATNLYPTDEFKHWRKSFTSFDGEAIPSKKTT
ncbi:hypothetical protein C5167_041385 [Papaver somniferum]|nr:hypothetical protein C5167_041385 [Papaver somniferum]